MILRLLSLLLLLSSESWAHLPSFRVVIDPGHGGSDEGTVVSNGRSRIAEKDLTLLLAQQVAQNLRARGFWVTLTRNEDREVTLPARTALANRLGADLFISIHMNSSEGSTWRRNAHEAEGVETYILNNTTDASSRRLARLENSVLRVTAEPNSPEQQDIALILKDLRLDANLSESKRLACTVQKRLVDATSQGKTSGKRNRGVKQALFHVLLGADMPSILVEAGFLNHPRDRDLVLSYKGRLAMSRAIATAIAEYKKERTLSTCKVN